ncbi:hypothetical protein, partial [Haematobacter missouriensis]|uniref:hypothetical protein n=1 Tax=Haematobacter missouriensis TaxID=366616 RepID=UPI001E61CE5F
LPLSRSPALPLSRSPALPLSRSDGCCRITFSASVHGGPAAHGADVGPVSATTAAPCKENVWGNV